jgi:hypothetical protein
MKPLDTKVYGVLFTVKDNKPIPPDEFIVFRPHDDLLEDTLIYYLGKCMDKGADRSQVEAVQELLSRVRAWREQHPDRCKLPDVTPEEREWTTPSPAHAAKPT